MKFSTRIVLGLLSVSTIRCHETVLDGVQTSEPNSGMQSSNPLNSGTEGIPGRDTAHTTCSGESCTPKSRSLKLTTFINGTQESREAVLQWESRRIQIVTQKMQHHLASWLFEELTDLVHFASENTTDIANITQRREALADAKIRAGDYAMRKLVYSNVFLSTAVSQLSKAFLKTWAICEIHLVSSRGTAEGFEKWFTTKILQNDERAMLIACPDHYVFGQAYGSGQDVIETTGGSILPSHFGINYNETANLPIENNSSFPVRFNGAAFNDYDHVIGGTNHQLRSLEEGFEIHPKIFFPSILPNHIIAEHRWHLACEFSNWITAYIDETGDE